MDYCSHEDNSNGIGAILALQMRMKESPTSMVDFCLNSDTIISQMNQSALDWIQEGKMVRINKVGGMCSIDDFDGYDEVVDINEMQMLNFFLHKDPYYSMKIEKGVLVIENASHKPTELIKILTSKHGVHIDNIQLVNNFKQRTMLFKEMDFYILFRDAIENGLKAIAFETSPQSVRQIDGLKQIIEKVMSGRSSNIKVFAKVSEKMKPLFTTKSKNIEIIFIDQ